MIIDQDFFLRNKLSNKPAQEIENYFYANPELMLQLIISYTVQQGTGKIEIACYEKLHWSVLGLWDPENKTELSLRYSDLGFILYLRYYSEEYNEEREPVKLLTLPLLAFIPEKILNLLKKSLEAKSCYTD